MQLEEIINDILKIMNNSILFIPDTKSEISVKLSDVVIKLREKYPDLKWCHFYDLVQYMDKNNLIKIDGKDKENISETLYRLTVIGLIRISNIIV